MKILQEILFYTFKWIGIFVLLILAIILSFICSSEADNYYIYHTRSLPKLQAEAQDEFIKYCKTEGVDPNSFQGPSVKVNESETDYWFTWSRPNDEEVYVSVGFGSYYDVLPSMSDSLNKRLQHERAQKFKANGFIPKWSYLNDR